MTRRADTPEDVLAAFAVEPTHDKTTLDSYLAAYPELTSELLELAMELEAGEDDSHIDLESPAVVGSWARYSQAGMGALTPASFSRETAAKLGIKTAVIVQLRDRAVELASIPASFLTRLAEALGTGIDQLSAYLSEPRTLAAGASYKSDGKPTAGRQMRLADVMAQCGHTPEEISRLLGEE